MGNEDFWRLERVEDEQLLGDVQALVRADRNVSARLLAHLAEVEERRLHLKHASSSMFEYAMRLGMSEDEAGRRLCAAGVAKRFPTVYPLLDEGKLSLSVICRLKQYITLQNHEEVLIGVSGLSARKADAWLAARFPRPDALSTIRKRPEQRAQSASAQPPAHEAGLAPPSTPAKERAPLSAPEALKLTPSPSKRADRGIVEPLAAERYRVQFTANQELKDKLELAADLMAHRNPSRDFAPIVDKALDLLIAELKKERFGQTTRPRRARKAKQGHVSNASKRTVLERDGLQCAYVDEHGKRCPARAFLERDHRVPRAKGGGPEPENLRHLCRPHNQFVAEREFGRAHIEHAKNKRREQAEARRSGGTLERNAKDDRRSPVFDDGPTAPNTS
ncbi:MAG TPA: HNH endonuclease signature motif containing protein [Polyangiaceae bacterium]|nr:HNH endonuclease signature motif containing protein [Polyangiaceae bacterium]